MSVCNLCCCRRDHDRYGPVSDVLLERTSASAHNPGGAFQEYTFVNHQGLRLWAYSRMPSGPRKGVVVLMHGVGVHALFEFLLPEKPGGPHTSLKTSLVEALVDAGFAVYMADMQGHGQSGAARGEPWFFEEFADVAKDFLLFVDLVRKREKDQKMFALGISMGGGIAVKASIMRPDFVEGMVLLAPMLSLEKLAAKPINRILRPMASCISSACPTALVAAIEKNEKFPLVEQEKVQDRLCNHRTFMCARIAAECLNFCESMTKGGGFKAVQTPFLTCHSPDDTFVDPISSERLHAEAASTDKKFVPATGMWHALTAEPGRERIFEEVVAWLTERV